MATALKTGEDHVLPTDTILIDGQWRSSASGGTMEHVNPATGRAQARFAVGGAREIDDAVQAAKRAFPAWRKLTANVRRDILLRFAQLLRENEARFLHIAALEAGTPVSMNSLDNVVDQVV
ncbi:MAG: aldehyde dehydrogenase family protein, partial [Hyphomicrobiaceae bacterium]